MSGTVTIMRRHHGELTAIQIERSPTVSVVRYDSATGPVGQIRAITSDSGGWLLDGGAECSPI